MMGFGFVDSGNMPAFLVAGDGRNLRNFSTGSLLRKFDASLFDDKVALGPLTLISGIYSIPRAT